MRERPGFFAAFWIGNFRHCAVKISVPLFAGTHMIK